MNTLKATKQTANPSDESPEADPARWVDEHGDMLFRYALRHVGNQDVAEELVQEALLSAIKGFDNFKGTSKVRTWLTSILRHKIIDRYRKNSREPYTISSTYSEEQEEQPIVENLANSTDNWSLDPNNHLEQKEFLGTLEGCLDKLPEKLKTLFVMREVEGLSREEIRNEFDLSSTHIGVLLHRARTQLRKCIQTRWTQDG